jgi:monoamine oxidase
MARSPLFTTLRRAFKIAQLSDRSGIPSDELLDILREKLSRRRVMRGGLAVAGAIAGASLSQAIHPSNAAARSKVLIIGAGIAGLTAGYRLSQAGVAVDIIEARNSVGGRMRSLSNAIGTQRTIELGGEFIDSGHASLRGLAAELGLTLSDLELADGDLIRDTYFFEGRKIAIDEIVRDFAPLAPILERDAAIAEDLTSPDAIALDRLSIPRYLAQQPITPLLQKILALAYTTEYGRDASEQSCLNLVFLIGTDATDFKLYGESDERFHIIGGNAQVPKLLAQKLNAAIDTGTELEAIRSLSDGRYQVSLRSGFKTYDRKYERILITIPFSVLRTIKLAVELPRVKRRAIDRLGYGTNSKLITAYRDRIWRTQYGSAAATFTDLNFQTTWEPTRYAPGVSGLVTSYTGGRLGVAIGAGTPESQAQRVVPQYDRVFPGIANLRQGSALRAYWTGEQYSRGSYACYLVGQWTRFFGEEGKRVGNLFFAGEHCSEDYQGYMEGGCVTGEAAAQEILQDLSMSSSVRRRSQQHRHRPKPGVRPDLDD